MIPRIKKYWCHFLIKKLTSMFSNRWTHLLLFIQLYEITTILQNMVPHIITRLQYEFVANNIVFLFSVHYQNCRPKKIVNDIIETSYASITNFYGKGTAFLFRFIWSCLKVLIMAAIYQKDEKMWLIFLDQNRWVVARFFCKLKQNCAMTSI